MKKLIYILLSLSSFSMFSQSPEQNLKSLSIELPKIPNAIGNYVAIVKVGNLLFLSGKGPLQSDGSYITGTLGKDLTTEEGFAAARLATINQLAVLEQELGDLSKIKRFIKVNGFINSSDSFTEQSKVMNGCSDLLVKIFGESGKHARTSVGVNSLPLNMSVEIEMIVEIIE